MNLQFEYSAWFLVLCLILASFYAWLMYQKKGPWSIRTKQILFAFRWLTAFTLALLLLSPLLRQIQNEYEKPNIVFAIDNSSSINQIHSAQKLDELTSGLSELKENLSSQGFEIQILTLGGKIEEFDSLQFDYQTTPLSELFKNLQIQYQGTNVQSVVLVSDGIYNSGLSPSFRPNPFSTHTLALGDTLPRRDVILGKLNYNKLSYQGNQFPLIAELSHHGFSSQSVNIKLEKSGKTIAETSRTLGAESALIEVRFEVDANETGLQHLIVRVEPVEGEFTQQNNILHAYVEVVEGKEKILLAAASPHPDLKALKAAIETNLNYEVSLYIPGIQTWKEDQYDLVVLHQLPSRKVNDAHLNKIMQSKIAKWWIIGGQTDLAQFNSKNLLLDMLASSNETDQVRPVYNTSSNLFNYDAERQKQIESYPPVSAPFGRINIKSSFTSLLNQKIGSVKTERPLLVSGEVDEQKVAILLGEGLWQWRLDEYNETENTQSFDELTLKLVQYLSTKDDKRRFRIYPIRQEFMFNEAVTFETEVYNQLYEKVYGQNIKLSIKSESGLAENYSFVNSAGESKYKLGSLKEGIYQYTASTLLDGKEETVKGEFNVNSSDLESTRLTADHILLKKISKQTGGQFFLQLDSLSNYLASQTAQSIIHSQEELLPLINLKWIFFLVLLLISAEWFLRKYSGSY